MLLAGRALASLGIVAVLLAPHVATAQPEQAPNPYDNNTPDESLPPPVYAPPPVAPAPPPQDPSPPIYPAPRSGTCLSDGLCLPPPRPKTRFSVSPRASIGYSYAVEDHLFGANLALDLMAERPRMAAGGTLQLNLGRTVTGLTFAWLQWGGRFRWLVSPRVRLGFGVSFGVVFFERATVRNDPMKAFTIGPELDLAVDLVQFGEHRALFLAANVGFAAMIFAFQPVAATVSSGLGIRF